MQVMLIMLSWLVSHNCRGHVGVHLQPEIKPGDEDLWKEFLANPKSFIDLRPKKQGNPKRPDFKQKDSGLCLWLNTAPPRVSKGLDSGKLEADLDEGSIPEKVSP